MKLSTKQVDSIVENTVEAISTRISPTIPRINASKTKQFEKLATIVNTGKIPSPYHNFRDYLWDWYQDFKFKTPQEELNLYKSWLKDRKVLELAKQIKNKFKFDFIKNIKESIKEIEQGV